MAEEALFQDNNPGDRTLLNYIKQFPDLNQDFSHLILLITSGRFSNKKIAIYSSTKTDIYEVISASISQSKKIILTKRRHTL